MADEIQAQVDYEEQSGIVQFEEANLLGNAQKIVSANEDYRAAYNDLKNYFENTGGDGLGEAVSDDAYDAMLGVFNNNKENLEALFNYVDGVVAEIQRRTNAGAGVAEEGFNKISSTQY